MSLVLYAMFDIHLLSTTAMLATYLGRWLQLSFDPYLLIKFYIIGREETGFALIVTKPPVLVGEFLYHKY